jgi:cytochrome c556
MKSASLFVALLLCLNTAAFAQEEEQNYMNLMKSVSATVGSLRTNLEAQSGDSAAADAGKLKEIFAEVHSFWQKRNVSDAMKFAMDAQTGFQQVNELAAAGKITEASEALAATQTNCRGCHDAHRERGPDGAWRIKQ